MVGQLVIASGNRHKIEEFRALFSGSGFQLVAPQDVGVTLDVAEEGRTYLDNAILKARAYAASACMPALADDSGLEVDALSGEPGIFSARFGGRSLDDAGRIALLLERLRTVKAKERSARFRCVLAVAAPAGRVWTAEGRCEGTIALAPRGQNGFGYDPIFVVSGVGRTMAELSKAEKNRISHRARAVAALRAVLDPHVLERGKQRAKKTERQTRQTNRKVERGGRG